MAVLQAFPRTTPEAVGIPSKAIEAFLNNVRNAGIEMHSLMILRHGKICAEGWWKPYAPDKLHNVHSFTKTFVATALGMLVHEGKVSLEQPVISFFPEAAPENPSENLLKMNVSHLLSMSTGHHTEPAIRSEKDFLKAFLAWPVDHEPGSWFCYNSMATHAISRIIHKVTGQTFVEFLHDRLFVPMGFGDVQCSDMPDGFPSGGGGFALTTEDMCRLAQLYLNEGSWNGEQLVPAEWIRTAIVPQSDNSNGMHKDGNEDWEVGYGYQMWMNEPAHSYRFDGAFGQEALVCPEHDLAIICTAATQNLAYLLKLAWHFILDMAREAPLPENPQALASLRGVLASLKLEELKQEGVSWLQDNASGKRIRLSPNTIVPFAVNFFGAPPAKNPGFCAITPVFKNGEAELTVETPADTQVIKAGMDGCARRNLLVLDGVETEFYASAKWLEQNILSITWRTLRVVQSTRIDITYGLNKACVSVAQAPRGEEVVLEGFYAG